MVNEIPYQLSRDSVVEKIAALVKSDKIKGITGIRDLSDLKEPVKLLIDVKNDADPEIVLNQLYQFSPLQSSFSMIFLALVDGKPRELSIKQLLDRVHSPSDDRDPPSDRVSCGPGPDDASIPSRAC